jgi:hypothetical protein
VNQNVVRQIDLTTQVATHFLEITIKNEGPQATSQYNLAIPSAFASHLAAVTANDDHNKLQVKKGVNVNNDKQR